MKKEKEKDWEPSLAPGNKEILEISATREDKRKGNFTRVTTLSYDEVDPG
ncbi:MAG: hypothetical protein K6T65_07005 [Peptococcaceae bacterium]|nr:hypothetical protein [Peptococcaceae bacterium]